MITAALKYTPAPKGGRGRTITYRVVMPDGVILNKGDRLVPSSSLGNVHAMERAPLPLTLVFWRGRYVRTVCQDPVLNRCPLFCTELGTSPATCLAIDNLHTVNYGPMMRWTSAVIWRTIFSNPWGFQGGDEVRIELSVRRLKADLFQWYDDAQIPLERRMGDLTVKMIGSRMDCGFDLADVHPGCMMTSKAAETAVLMEWAQSLLRKYTDVPWREDLATAGEAISQWMAICRSCPLLVPHKRQQELRECAVRHVLCAQRAKLSLVPKHHMFIHSSVCLSPMGNPRFFATFLDESLNMLLRTLAAKAHRKKQAWRILFSFNLVGAMDLSPFVFGRSLAED